MPLFAETTEFEKWLGPVLTASMALVAALFAWLTARDKLRFDAERVQLRADIAALTERVKVCHDERDVLKAHVDRLERRMTRHENDGNSGHP